MPRISQLPSLTAADNADEIAIVDVSASTTKKITRGDLLKSPLPNNSVTTAAVANGSITASKLDFTTFPSFKATRTTTYSATGGTWSSYNPTTADWNIGSAFNTSSAVFTAPVAGIYRFDASIFLGAGSSNWGALRLNINAGAKLLDLISLQMTRVYTVQGGTEVKLNAGDTVKVEGYTATTVDVNNPATWFSGRLIQLS